MKPSILRRSLPLIAVLASFGVAVSACTARGQGPEGADGSDTTTTVAGTTGDRTDTTEPADPAGSLEWSACESGLECAEMAVPLDHDDPGGETITLGLIRRPAEDPAKRIGSLLFNPGGPGGSAVEMVQQLPLPSELTDRFDIVGVDPRGVGESSALDCHSYLKDIYDADPTMEDEADVDRYLEVSQKFVDECESKYAELLPHLGTVDVAKDMDLVRAALGDEQLSYVGYSYGTSIGQQYARLYPERVRALVLDGVVDPDSTGLEAAADQARGFDRALDAFVEGCGNGECGLEGDANEAIKAVLAASEKAPIPSAVADRPATPGVVSLALAQALYSEFLWPDLGRALEDGLAGDGSGLVDLADYYLGSDGSGGYDSGFEIYFAVSCLDSQWPSEPDQVLDEAKVVGERYPEIGEALVNDYVRCALWPTPPEPLEPIPSDIEGLDPIVFISTTGDPATPYESGVRVAERTPGARLITNEGEGHTIFAQGKPCVDDAVVAYLVDLELPEDGLTC